MCRMEHKAFRWDRIREVPVVPGEACLKGCTRTTCKRRWRWRRRRRCCNNKACESVRPRVAVEACLGAAVELQEAHQLVEEVVHPRLRV